MYDSKSKSQFLFITQRSKQPVFSNPSLITLQLKLYWFSMDKLQIKIYFKTIPSLWSDVENVTLWTMPSAEFGYIGVKINLTWNPWHNSPSSNSQNKLKSELLPPWNVVNYPPPSHSVSKIYHVGWSLSVYSYLGLETKVCYAVSMVGKHTGHCFGYSTCEMSPLWTVNTCYLIYYFNKPNTQHVYNGLSQEPMYHTMKSTKHIKLHGST